MSHDPHVVAGDLTPTPFTAEEIRAGCPPGRVIVLRVEVDGQLPFLRTNRFVECDDEGALIERSRSSLEGESLGHPLAKRSTWLELQRHAAFPADRTEIASTTLDSPLGVLECLHYTVFDGDDIDDFWFSPAYPGMPVKVVRQQFTAIVSTVTMIASTP
jgi:hypothetical protein